MKTKFSRPWTKKEGNQKVAFQRGQGLSFLDQGAKKKNGLNYTKYLKSWDKKHGTKQGLPKVKSRKGYK